jgi:hypothetical protein
MENTYMKKKIKYTNEKIGKVEVVKDFLPKPEIIQTKLFIESISRGLSDSDRGKTFSSSQLKNELHKKRPGKGK